MIKSNRQMGLNLLKIEFLAETDEMGKCSVHRAENTICCRKCKSISCAFAHGNQVYISDVWEMG